MATRASERLLVQLPAFAAVGVVNTSVDAAVFVWVVVMLGAGDGAAGAFASAVGFLAGAANSYFWNSRVTFAASRGDARRYFSVVLGALVLSTCTFSLVQRVTGAEPVGLAAAKAAALLVGTSWSFVLCRTWAFAKR